MDFNWRVLQNGSDIRGIAVAGVKGEEVNLDSSRTEQLGKAFYHWLLRKGYSELRIAVGRDSRISGPQLLKSFSKGTRILSEKNPPAPFPASTIILRPDNG